MYSGVPQIVFVFLFPIILQNPKSTSFKYPVSLIKIFSGFKSLYTMPKKFTKVEILLNFLLPAFEDLGSSFLGSQRDKFLQNEKKR